MELSSITPSYVMAKQHLEALSGRKDSSEVFQVYLDRKDIKPQSKIFIGTLVEHFDALVRYNIHGYAICVTVNETDLRGRKKENIIKVRALFTDDDTGMNINIGLAPSFKIKSKKGYHNYFLVDEISLVEFTEILKKLIQVTQTDPKINDLSRCMRLAGFFHMKNPNEPFLVEFEHGT